MPEILSYRDALRQTMRWALQENQNTVILGQGVSDPTSIFGTTKGLAEEFGDHRVIDFPISEEGMTGVAIGASLNGLYPIQTHIRVDFLLLAMNQLLNMAAKYKYMYGGSFSVPMLIRAVVGRSWGQGPQHSQSLQSLFAHIPGLTVIMPSTSDDVVRSYTHAVKNVKGPVLSIEHRFLYDFTFNSDLKADRVPFAARLVQEGQAATIVALSYMVQEAQLAADWIFHKTGHSIEIIDLQNISDIDHNLIAKSLKKTGKLLVADTGWLTFGVSSEISRGILERDPTLLKAPLISLGMQQTPTPTSHALERHFYPDMITIVDSVYSLISGSKQHGYDLPTEEFQKNLRVKFKGPF